MITAGQREGENGSILYEVVYSHLKIGDNKLHNYTVNCKAITKSIIAKN